MLSLVPRLLVRKNEFPPIGILGIFLSSVPKLDNLKGYEVINFLLKVSTFFMSVLGNAVFVGTSFEQQFFFRFVDSRGA
jgi:hypothetical protein